jgi:hypothetical protein
MDSPKHMDPSLNEEKNNQETETDERLQEKLKELIELNELQTGAFKKMMHKLQEQREKDEESD